MQKKIFALVTFGILIVTHNTLSYTWENLLNQNKIHLYAGDIVDHQITYHKSDIGISLIKNDKNHIRHDITNPMPLPDNCVDKYQSEDVFEHIEYKKLLDVINEIYRVLKPGGLLRISIPDYRSDIYYSRSLKDENGAIIFDPGGGGNFENGKVVNGGHVWFPTIEKITFLLENTKFYTHGKIECLHYYDVNGNSI